MMAHLGFVHTTIRQFDEDQARRARITRLPGESVTLSREIKMIISAASDYRAAAQRILPPSFPLHRRWRLWNIRCAATWKIWGRWLYASEC
jgi:hypothetical protein